MFKKTKIAAVSAAVLGLSSMAAQAVSTNNAGSAGQALIFPYYNVNNGYVTAFNITNTTAAYKAVKIRFRESENSNDVLDFNLYLSPFDVFTINLSKGADEGVVLKTSDNTCTHPAIPAGGVLFRHTAYASTSVADVREGYLEVIEMGEVSQTATIIDALGAPQLIASQGILHDANGMPLDCGVINQAWLQGVFIQGGAAANAGLINTVSPKPTGYPLQAIPSAAGFYGQADMTGVDAQNQVALTPPTGGLVGTSILVDTLKITGYVAEPTSVLNYSSVAQHYLSSDENLYLLPSLASGDISFSERATGPVTYLPVVRDFGLDDENLLPRTSVPSGINPLPLADALLVSKIGNQYFLQGSTLTDWVVSAPMRKHAIYNDYQYVPAGGVPAYVKGTPADLTAVPPVAGIGDIPIGGAIGDAAAPLGHWSYLADANDVNATFIYFDREEQAETPEPGDFSPPILTPAVEVPFSREVNIIALNSGSNAASVLGSVHAQSLTLAPGFDDGWGSFAFDPAKYNLVSPRYAAWMTGTNAGSAQGVPLTGFMAARADLGAESVGETFPHFVEVNYGVAPAPNP